MKYEQFLRGTFVFLGHNAFLICAYIVLLRGFVDLRFFMQQSLWMRVVR